MARSSKIPQKSVRASRCWCAAAGPACSATSPHGAAARSASRSAARWFREPRSLHGRPPLRPANPAPPRPCDTAPSRAPPRATPSAAPPRAPPRAAPPRDPPRAAPPDTTTTTTPASAGRAPCSRSPAPPPTHTPPPPTVPGAEPHPLLRRRCRGACAQLHDRRQQWQGRRLSQHRAPTTVESP